MKLKKLISKLFSRRAFKIYLLLALIGYLLFELVIFWGVRAYPYVSEPLISKRPSTVYYDCRGNVIWAKMGQDDVWQVPVEYKEFSPDVIKAILSAEDKRFFDHNGVDYLRMVRAALSNLTSGRVVSGASTVSMQVVRMTTPEKRSWGYKFRQIFMALDMERKFSKEWILTQYLNNAPFGSNLVGIEAASLYYFGKPASVLNLEEASLLCSLPQRPSFLRPDRYPERALKRQKWVLEQIEKNYKSGLGKGKLNAYYRQVFTPPGKHGKLGHKLSEPHYVSLIKGKTDSAVHTCLDPSLQQLALQNLKGQVAVLDGVKDGAAVIIENNTGALRAMVGSLDFEDREGGQVNVATSKRSPGSALKPFIYLEAIEQGKIVAETVLNDSPITGSYQPGNFDKLYRGKVTAEQALSSSLNTTAVRLLKEVGLETVLERLVKFNVSTLKKGAAHYGLSLALGGGEVKLLELANAYAALARKGAYKPIKVFDDEDYRSRREIPVCDPGSAELLTQMLCSRKLPGHDKSEIAWKTGTSNGLRDAWCIAYTKDYTVGVWLGNKNGRPANSLVGFKAAVPVVSNIFKGIYNTQTVLFPATENLEDVKITEESGLRARASHTAAKLAKKVKGIPLKFCSRKIASSKLKEDKNTKDLDLHILSPRKDNYYTAEDTLTLKLQTNSSTQVYWFINGELKGSASQALSHDFKPGKYRIRIMSMDGKYNDTKNITVEKI